VRLDLSLEEARGSAVGSVRTTIALVRLAMHSGQFEKLDYVSTIGVAGRHAGRIAETPMPRPRLFHNTYEEAKAEAEDHVLEAMASGLPVTIHRPSMVIGAAADGKIIRFQIFYALCDLFSGTTTRGVFVDTGDAVLDTVPVDFVASAIHWASTSPSTCGRIFHLCSGGRAATIRELTASIRAFRARRGDSLPTLRRVPLPVFERAISVLARVAPQKARRRLRTLSLVTRYLHVPQSFESTETERVLASAGIRLPSPREYLEGALAYHRAVSSETSSRRASEARPRA
jgi:nucleoside-diphosphate-sugar epimerase